MKNTLGWMAHPGFFLAGATAIVGCPIHDAASSRHGWDCTAAPTLGGGSKPYERIVGVPLVAPVCGFRSARTAGKGVTTPGGTRAVSNNAAIGD
jgi:hypothetical protein